MRRKLNMDEKRLVQAERYKIEQASFPNLEIEVVVDDYTWDNGEPNVRVVRRLPRTRGMPTGPKGEALTPMLVDRSNSLRTEAARLFEAAKAQSEPEARKQLVALAETYLKLAANEPFMDVEKPEPFGVAIALPAAKPDDGKSQ
jgi:hypothetical protein